jgi:Ty3 transposon capsid-like protein
MVNVRVPTEQNLSGSHHSVIPQVGQETPLQPAMHSPFLRFPKPEKFTGKFTDSNTVENWILAMDNLFVAQGNFLAESQKLAYAVGFLTEDALTWWLAEMISPDAPHTWTALKLALISYLISPVKVSDAKDRLLSLNQKSAEGISGYVTEFQRLLILAQISNETDKVYTFLCGLRRFTAGSVRMHRPNTLQEAIRLALEFEAAFKGSDSQRGCKRSNESGSIQPAGKCSKISTGNRNGGGSMGRIRPFGFHRGDRKAQPQTVAERYQKTPAEIEALKRQKARFACGQKSHMAQACKSKN